MAGLTLPKGSATQRAVWTTDLAGKDWWAVTDALAALGMFRQGAQQDDDAATLGEILGRIEFVAGELVRLGAGDLDGNPGRVEDWRANDLRAHAIILAARALQLAGDAGEILLARGAAPAMTGH